MTIESLRTQINMVDERLEEILVQRLGLIKQVGEIKKQNHLPILDQKREKMIVKSMKDRIDKEFEPYVQKLFTSMFEISRDYQKHIIEGE